LEDPVVAAKKKALDAAKASIKGNFIMIRGLISRSNRGDHWFFQRCSRQLSLGFKQRNEIWIISRRRRSIKIGKRHKS